MATATIPSEHLKDIRAKYIKIKRGSQVYYDSEKNEFRLERLDKNFKTINHENLSLGNLKLNGDIIFEQGSRKTISNVSDPISENEVATKRYVDQMCSGLQEYIVADFLLLEEDVIYSGEEMEILRQVGDLGVDKLVFILTPDMFNYWESQWWNRVEQYYKQN